MTPFDPLEAFEFYRALGPTRTYWAVAAQFGVSPRTVTKHAGRDRWRARLREEEDKARRQAREDCVAARVTTGRFRLLDPLEGINEEWLSNLFARVSPSLEEWCELIVLGIAHQRLLLLGCSRRDELRKERVLQRLREIVTTLSARTETLSAASGVQ